MAIKKGLNWTIIGALSVGMIIFMSIFSSANEPTKVKHQDSNRMQLPERADHDSNENTINTFTASNEALIKKTQDALSSLEDAKQSFKEETGHLASEAKKYDKIMRQNERQAKLIKDLEKKYHQLTAPRPPPPGWTV